MELFTMTPNFLPDEPIDGFISSIWTERFFTNGDCQIVVPAEVAWRQRLREGKFLGLRGSKEVMILESHNVDKGLLTVTGATLDKFLNERQAWFENGSDNEGEPSTKEYAATTTAGQMLADVVTKAVINPQAFSGHTNANLDWAREKIENLTLGEYPTNGDVRPRTFPIGQLYDGLKTLATANGIGFRVYLDWVTEDDYSLKFAAWRGLDRTSQQDDLDLVRLSPNLNSLMDTKEILSIAEYKNVAYVHFKNQIYTFYAEPSLPIPEGFSRRSMVRMAEGDVANDQLAAYLAQHAADAFANNNYIRAIDGEASIPSQFVYQRDYRLGDIIELEGLTGLLTKARVTEYIRSQDKLGDRAYPTISVVDPLDSGNLPTLDDWFDESDDFEPDYPLDPDYPDPDPDDPDPDPIPDPDPGPGHDPNPYPKPKPSPRPHPSPNPNPPDPDPDPDPEPPPDPDPDPDPSPDPGPHPPSPVDPQPIPGLVFVESFKLPWSCSHSGQGQAQWGLDSGAMPETYIGWGYYAMLFVTGGTSENFGASVTYTAYRGAGCQAPPNPWYPGYYVIDSDEYNTSEPQMPPEWSIPYMQNFGGNYSWDGDPISQICVYSKGHADFQEGSGGGALHFLIYRTANPT